MIIVVNGHPGTDPVAFAKRLAAALQLPYLDFNFYEPSAGVVKFEFGAVFTGDAYRLFPEAMVFLLKPEHGEDIFAKAILFCRMKCLEEAIHAAEEIRVRV